MRLTRSEVLVDGGKLPKCISIQAVRNTMGRSVAVKEKRKKKEKGSRSKS
jgi:hypothetical protein